MTKQEEAVRHAEMSAYTAVLKAYIAANLLDWDTEELFDKLKVAFHITPEVHQDILSKVEADEEVIMLRALFTERGRAGDHGTSLKVVQAKPVVEHVAPSMSQKQSVKKHKPTTSMHTTPVAPQPVLPPPTHKPKLSAPAPHRPTIMQSSGPVALKSAPLPVPRGILSDHELQNALERGKREELEALVAQLTGAEQVVLGQLLDLDADKNSEELDTLHRRQLEWMKLHRRELELQAQLQQMQ